MNPANIVFNTKLEEEWQELQTVLQSGFLDKSQNLKRFLEYVAHQHFSGNNEPVKEYSIAVQALNRMQQFDPQSDAIVRVTAHTLRKETRAILCDGGVPTIQSGSSSPPASMS